MISTITGNKIKDIMIEAVSKIRNASIIHETNPSNGIYMSMNMASYLLTEEDYNRISLSDSLREKCQALQNGIYSDCYKLYSEEIIGEEVKIKSCGCENCNNAIIEEDCHNGTLILIDKEGYDLMSELEDIYPDYLS